MRCFLCIVLVLISPFLLQANSEVRYFGLADGVKLNYTESVDRLEDQSLQGDVQTLGYLDYRWSSYLGFGLQMGTTTLDDTTPTSSTGATHQVELQSTYGHALLNLHLPLFIGLKGDVFYGVGYHYTQADIRRTQSNGRLESYRLEQAGEHQTWGVLLSIPLIWGVSVGMGASEHSPVLEKDLAIQPATTGQRNEFWVVKVRWGGASAAE